MKRFILPEKPDRDGLVRLSGDDYRYLVRVRRLRTGCTFPALYGGEAGVVTVLSTGGRVLAGRFETRGLQPEADAKSGGCFRRVREQSETSLVLFQALPRGRKIDLVIRQAAEISLAEVVVFVSEYSAARPETGRLDRWKRIVKEARQQSGSDTDTQLRFFPSFEAALAYWNGLAGSAGNSLGILLHPGTEPDTVSARGTLEQGTFHDYLNGKLGLVVLAVGPEGGFSGTELSRFLESGFRPVRMAASVLRTETAALYGAAAVQIILWERSAWTSEKKQTCPRDRREVPKPRP